MTDAEHRSLGLLLRNCKAKVVISGYRSPLYDELYAGWRLEAFGVANHAAVGEEKSEKVECLWMNY